MVDSPPSPVPEPTEDALARMDAALRAQGPYPVPLGLVASVLRAVAREPRHGSPMLVARAPHGALAIAAAVLLVLGTYLALGGTDLVAGVSSFSRAADGASPAAFRIGLDGGARGLDDVGAAVTAGYAHVAKNVEAVASTTDVVSGEPLLWLPVSVVSLVVGLALARRVGGRPARPLAVS